MESYRTENGEFSSIILNREAYFDAELKKALADSVAKCTATFLKKNKIRKQGLILVVGVGNDGMMVDALGVRTLSYLKVTENLFQDGVQEPYMGRLAAIRGSVSGVTGLKSFDIVKAVVDRVKPAAIILVDTLSCKRASRLQRVIQITDMGLVPGSGIGKSAPEISAETLAVPVIAIGVPLVIYASNIVSEYIADGTASVASDGVRKISGELQNLYVTVKDIDLAVECFAEIIGNGINAAVHRHSSEYVQI